MNAGPHNEPVSIDRLGQAGKSVKVDTVANISDCTPVYFNKSGGWYKSSVALTVYVSADDGDDDPYEPYYDKNGEPVVLDATGATKKEFPDSMFSVGFTKFVGPSATEITMFGIG